MYYKYLRSGFPTTSTKASKRVELYLNPKNDVIYKH